MALALPAPALPLGLVATAPSGTPSLLEVVAAGAGAGAAEPLRRGGVSLRWALRPWRLGVAGRGRRSSSESGPQPSVEDAGVPGLRAGRDSVFFVTLSLL